MFVELGGCMSAVRKRAEFLPEFQPYYLHLVQVSCDGMDSDHMSFPSLSVLQALIFFKSLSQPLPSRFSLLLFFVCHCSHSHIWYNLFTKASSFVCISLLDWKLCKGKGIYLSLFTSEFPVLTMASLKKYLLNGWMHWFLYQNVYYIPVSLA